MSEWTWVSPLSVRLSSPVLSQFRWLCPPPKCPALLLPTLTGALGSPHWSSCPAAQAPSFLPYKARQQQTPRNAARDAFWPWGCLSAPRQPGMRQKRDTRGVTAWQQGCQGRRVSDGWQGWERQSFCSSVKLLLLWRLSRSLWKAEARQPTAGEGYREF